ncbi:MAG: prepilin-type N-terminal cleavage/methylation domain-containing protein [Pirellulales bacterium]|nr:prepilin-type N-terminal cleavage/methylation domain-containing protein [Pirellulales bacterium]
MSAHTQHFDCGRPTRHVRRRAMTLIELLVVIAIVLSISAVALPILAPRGESRRQREAARILTTFINSARTRAIEIGRPVGVWIEGVGGGAENILSLSTCEVPAPYTGDTFSSKIAVRMGTNGRAYIAGFSPINPPPGFIHSWDTIQLGGRGPRYAIVLDQTNNGSGELDDTNLDAVDNYSQPLQFDTSLVYKWWLVPLEQFSSITAPAPSNTYTYAIERKPVKSLTPPVELPRGAIVNMDFSSDDLLPFHPRLDPAKASFWIGDHDWDGNATTDDFARPLVILFGANGALESIYRFVPNSIDPASATGIVYARQPVFGSVYLLLGEVENAEVEGAPDQQEFLDLLDPDTQWVTIDARTGAARSAENVVVPESNPAAALQYGRWDPPDPSTFTAPSEAALTALLGYCRQGLTQGPGRGGR